MKIQRWILSCIISIACSPIFACNGIEGEWYGYWVENSKGLSYQLQVLIEKHRNKLNATFIRYDYHPKDRVSAVGTCKDGEVSFDFGNMVLKGNYAANTISLGEAEGIYIKLSR